MHGECELSKLESCQKVGVTVVACDIDVSTCNCRTRRTVLRFMCVVSLQDKNISSEVERSTSVEI